MNSREMRLALADVVAENTRFRTERADLLAALENIALLRTVPPRSATADQRLTAAVNLANHAIAAAHQGEGT